MKTLKDQVIVVSGGSSGIGAAICRAAIAKGAKAVYALSRSGNIPENCEGNIVGISADVRAAACMKAVAQGILKNERHIDALVLAAGNGIAGAIEETSDVEARYQFETCFFGLHNAVQAFLPSMRKAGKGKIITIASVASLVPIPYQAFYSAVKAAVMQYSDALAIEINQFGLQCCCVLPGDTKTGFTAARKYTEKANEQSPYHTKRSKSVSKMEKDEKNGMPPEAIASAAIRQLCRKKMTARVIPGFGYKAISVLLRIFPTRLVRRIVEMLY